MIFHICLDELHPVIRRIRQAYTISALEESTYMHFQ